MARLSSKKGGLFAFSLRRDRAVWRDADAFMRTMSDEGEGAPLNVQWVAGESELEASRWWTDVFGLVNDQAKIELWRHVRLPVYPAIVRSPERQQTLVEALERAGRQASGGTASLQRALRECAAYVRTADKGYGELSNQGRQDARALADALGGEALFWSRLETPFYAWLQELAAAGEGALDVPLARWTRTLHRTALSAYADATDSLGESARHVRARAEGQSYLRAVAAYADLIAA
jgi:CRISPR system Cascade subunit CasA